MDSHSGNRGGRPKFENCDINDRMNISSFFSFKEPQSYPIYIYPIYRVNISSNVNTKVDNNLKSIVQNKTTR